MSLFDSLINEDEQLAKAKRINGIVIGIVTNNKDPEGLGRVKITFPWLSGDNETDWARVATSMGGKEMGIFFLPEVEDQVIVAFEQGDVNRPFVIGSLWSKEDKPPEKNADGKNNIRKIKSRSGHEIILDDSDAKEKLSLHTKGGHQIVLDDSSGQEKITIKDKSESNFIELDSSQNSILISSQMKISLKSTEIEVEASGNMTLKAGGILTIQGSLVKIN